MSRLFLPNAHDKTDMTCSIFHRLHHQKVSDKWCVFLELQIFVQFPSSIHIKLYSVGLQRKWCLIFQSWNYAALILNTVCSSFFFFWSFCHVIEDKCWKHSFKRSMRLKCTARKECIKYINKYIYLKSFIPKWYIYIHHLGGKKSLNSYKMMTDRKDPKGGLL